MDELSRDECMRLLAEHHFGRIGFVVDDQPLVFPVNYAMAGSDVVFRSDDGLKMRNAVGANVAFEIDHADHFSHDGWSVLVVGLMEQETNSVLIRELERLPVASWVPGIKPFWVRIRTHAVSGRRVSHAHQAALETRGNERKS